MSYDAAQKQGVVRWGTLGDLPREDQKTLIDYGDSLPKPDCDDFLDAVADAIIVRRAAGEKGDDLVAHSAGDVITKGLPPDAADCAIGYADTRGGSVPQRIKHTREAVDDYMDRNGGGGGGGGDGGNSGDGDGAPGAKPDFSSPYPKP